MPVFDKSSLPSYKNDPPKFSEASSFDGDDMSEIFSFLSAKGDGDVFDSLLSHPPSSFLLNGDELSEKFVIGTGC